MARGKVSCIVEITTCNCRSRGCYYWKNSVSLDECEELRRFCEEDVKQFTIVDLEKHLDNYPVAALVLPACHKFYILFKASQSDITAKLRSDFLREVDSYESFAKDAWPHFYDRLKEKVDNMRQLRIPCEEAAKLLLGTSAKRSPELQKLVMALNQCEGSPKDGNEWIKRILDHTVVYSRAKRSSQTAQLLLEVKDSLQLMGDFDRAENIAHVSYQSSQSKNVTESKILL